MAAHLDMPHSPWLAPRTISMTRDARHEQHFPKLASMRYLWRVFQKAEVFLAITI